MDLQTLTFNVTDHIATITLNRPEAVNAMNRRFMQELFAVACRCDSDDDIRAVILTGAGRFFSAGGDLKEFAEQGDDLPGYVTELATFLHAAVTRLQRMNAPLIVAVNGMAAGGGLSLVSAGDQVIAGESAAFTCAYTNAGITPDGSSTYFLAKHIGLLRAKELVLTNRRLSAAEALDWGLVSQVVSNDQLLVEAMAMAKVFANGPTQAYGGAKRLLLSAFSGSLETQLEEESASITRMARSHDGREGIDAFANRRTPNFKGI